VRAIASTLGLSRSNLIERHRRQYFVRPRRRIDDSAVTEQIKQVVDARPSYGYLRTTRLVSRAMAARVNRKRVYRIMKAQGWLLARHTGKSTRTHDGVIMTLRSNLRWCSDASEIRCWSGERVQVAFRLDFCDREVMSYIATTAAITGEMIRELMAESVERRFGAEALQTPQPVEWLSDNGPPYTAIETRDFGQKLGLLVCTTPAYSPESNGMAESFVKTFKRDYVYLNELHTATSVMQQLARWFEDYNEVHPHKGIANAVTQGVQECDHQRLGGPVRRGQLQRTSLPGEASLSLRGLAQVEYDTCGPADVR
jgi:putative transposase